jgi:hypothetical protein
VNWVIYALGAWIAAGALFCVATIGKARKPTTPGTAAFVVIIDAAIVVLLVLAARRLS